MWHIPDIFPPARQLVPCVLKFRPDCQGPQHRPTAMKLHWSEADFCQGPTPYGRCFLDLPKAFMRLQKMCVCVCVCFMSAAFEEVFVATYVLLDKRWLEMRATYMEFPQVLK